MNPLIVLMQLASFVFPNAAIHPSPGSVVRELYQQVIVRRPLGIPKGEDKAAIWPYLSKGLIHKVETAQACEDSYFQQHKGEDGKPGFEWFEVNLFSGGNEQAIYTIPEHTKPTPTTIVCAKSFLVINSGKWRSVWL